MKATKFKNRKCFGMVLFFFLFGTIFPRLHAQSGGFVFKDPQYSFQLLRTMGYSTTGGADIGECLYTARQIKDGDNASWYNQWYNRAAGLEKMAESFLSEGHTESAREAYFRASNYYRTAEFFLHTTPADPRIVKTWRKSRQCFQKAARLSEKPIKFVRIPFGKTTMPGYLCLVDNSGKKRPLLIVHSGFDGTVEELYFEIASLAVKRGFNCLLFEGPGQGEMIRVQKIPFRPDWENVVSPVVDYALKLPETDPERIGLVGYSFGGYLAPRAVAFEHRIKACVADGGVFDFYANAIKKCPPNITEILGNKQATEGFNKEITGILDTDVDVGWFFGNGMFTFGAKTPAGFLKMLRTYNLRKVADKIKCHVLVVDSDNDQDLPGQAMQLYQALKCPKKYLLFTTQEGAGDHCQMGAVMISNEKILNWLKNTLK
jgi:dienelactone hydrolase